MVVCLEGGCVVGDRVKRVRTLPGVRDLGGHPFASSINARMYQSIALQRT